MTGPALRLLSARAACSPAAMNAYTANKMTSASTVTEGQASAMNPMITARMPRAIRDVLSDLSMTVPFGCVAAGFPGCLTPPVQLLTR